MDTANPNPTPSEQSSQAIENALSAPARIKQITSPLVWPAGHAGAIAYADGIFEESFCSNLIKWCQDHPQRSKVGLTMGGVKLDTKVSTDWNLLAEMGELEQEFDSRIFEGLWGVIEIYQRTFKHLQDPENVNSFASSDTGYQIQKYDKNIGFYTSHIDGSPWTNVAALRSLGAIIYLNTVDVGGETNFPLHNIKVGAVAGRVSLFPAYWTHPHGGLMPMSSDKWIISSFIEAAHPQSCTCETVRESDSGIESID